MWLAGGAGCPGCVLAPPARCTGSGKEPFGCPGPAKAQGRRGEEAASGSARSPLCCFLAKVNPPSARCAPLPRLPAFCPRVQHVPVPPVLLPFPSCLSTTGTHPPPALRPPLLGSGTRLCPRLAQPESQLPTPLLPLRPCDRSQCLCTGTGPGPTPPRPLVPSPSTGLGPLPTTAPTCSVPVMAMLEEEEAGGSRSWARLQPKVVQGRFPSGSGK